MSERQTPKRPHGMRAFALTMVAALVMGGLAGAGSALLEGRSGPRWMGLTVVMIASALAGGLAACMWWWRGIDEAAREAHKWAWWWGGSGGMVVGALMLLTLKLRAETDALPFGFGSTSADIFASGMTTILLFQVVGYAVAWAGWWLKHR